MRRAIRSLLNAVLAFSLLPALAHAQASKSFNGIGLVDYSRKPDFKVGDWVRYHMTGKSEMGMSDDYQLTLLVAGEEDFWGDPGFWLETWVEGPGMPPRATASLVSYEAFTDTAAVQRLLLYTRKMITLLNEDGTPKIDINKPASSTLKARHDVMNPVSYSRQPLGRDTITTPKGTFAVEKVLMKQGKGVTSVVGDSSLYTELREDRTSHYSPLVPITHLVREDIVTGSTRKTWLIGRSGEGAPMFVRDQGEGAATLIDFGHGNLEARMVPQRLRKSLSAQAKPSAAAQPTKSAAKPAPKPATKKP
jgi:hypothetical protein